MASLRVPEIGETVKLIGLSAVKMRNDKIASVNGYCAENTEIEVVTISDFIGGDTIIGTNGCLYPLVPEFDNDFYAVVYG